MTAAALDDLVALVREATDRSREADRAVHARDVALDRLCMAVGGDRLAAIRNGHTRIGEMTTGARS